ncbi:type II secretion system minor pseudopilin GspI [Thiohalobacter sp. COW1]
MRREETPRLTAAIRPLPAARLPVIPAQAGIQIPPRPLDPGLRRDDGNGCAGRVGPSGRNPTGTAVPVGLRCAAPTCPGSPHASRLTPHAHRGFTLMELLVALLVISLGMLAAVKAGGSYAGNLDYLQQRTYAHWVARNVLNELRLTERSAGSRRRQDETRFAELDWHWEVEFEDTPDPDLVRAEIRVWRGRDDDGEPLALLTGFMERP